jgi:U3 small nucleolar RNA-associated protein 10
MSTAAKVVALARANLANQPTAIASSSIHLLQNLAIALSALVSPFLPDILSSSLSSPSAVSATRMETFRRNLVKSLPAKVLLPALAQSWPRRDPTESINLIKLLRDSLDRTTPEELGVTHKRVFQMLLLMLEADDGSINQAARHAYLAFALKLNENMFKPLFQQTVDWAFAEGKGSYRKGALSQADEFNAGSLPKQVTLLRLANEMADELQSIFIPFFKHLFTNCVSVLEGLAARPNQDTALLEALLELLITVFSFSDADYWTRTKLDQLASPLLEQLAHLGKHRSTGVLALYKSALVALIKVDSADEGFVRSINSQLLRLTRTHGLVALQALEALWLQASDVMLSLGVAETVPFLVECLEDDEARVVEAAKALVAAIEGEWACPHQRS